MKIPTLEEYLAKHPEYGWKAKESDISRRLAKNPALSKMMFGTSVVFKNMRPGIEKGIAFGYGFAGSKLPGKWDWRYDNDGGWVTPVRDQESCGSCVAFGTIAALESALMIQYYKEPSKNLDYSEAFLFFCSGRRDCEEGWIMDEALDCIMRDGVPPEECLPYAVDADCGKKRKDWRQLIGPTKDITWSKASNNIDDMKRRLVAYGPQIAAFDVYSDFIYYHSGVYKPVQAEWNEACGGHCVCVIGYDEREKCWICKNSWDNDWGDQGYFKIDYSCCNILEYGFYTIVALPKVDKKVVDAVEKIKRIYYLEVIDQDKDMETTLKVNQNNQLFLEKLQAGIQKIAASKTEEKLAAYDLDLGISALSNEVETVKQYLDEKLKR